MPQDVKKTCFVIMGFGKKTDFETGRVLDLDMSYNNMIKPAVEAAGLICTRADEIVHSGLIDVPMYEQLLNADVVVADLSTSNKNAFYELGVRHALRPYTTVVVAEDGIKTFPFDVNHVAVRQYHHLGEDIGYGEVIRFRNLLTSSITSILNKNPLDKDSPIYTFLSGLNPPAIAAVVHAALQGATSTVEGKEPDSTDQSSNGAADTGNSSDVSATHSALMQQVNVAQAKKDWITAKTLLTLIRQMAKDEIAKKQQNATREFIVPPEDPYLLQRLALATYKSKSPNEKDALLEAHQLLNLLNPGTSNDSETLGLWGAVHKRLWEVEKKDAYLEEAVNAYKRGYYLKRDYYNGINYAYLLNLRAANTTDRAEAIADFVEAGRVRKDVLLICEQWLKENASLEAGAPKSSVDAHLASWYWVMATQGEALVGLGDEVNAVKLLQQAYDKAPEGWMKDSTEDQLAKLRGLLKSNPLQYIRQE